MAYAESTNVSIPKTKADIEELIIKAGAEQFVSGVSGDLAVIGFKIANRQIRFVLPLPKQEDYAYTPNRNQKRSAEQARKAWEQACRSRWRGLYLVIKAKLEAVESGISTLEREFFYDIILPNGQTVGAYMQPQIENCYETGSMPPLLPFLEDN